MTLDRQIPDYNYLLDNYTYKSEKSVIAVLRNLDQLIELGGLGVSSALSIVADISKAILCRVDDYNVLTKEEFLMLYYAYICDFGIFYSSMLCNVGIEKAYRLISRAISKILYVLGEANGNEPKRAGKAGRQNLGGRQKEKQGQT